VDLHLRLQHRLPVQPVRPGHGDAGRRPRLPHRADDDRRPADAAQLGEDRVTAGERLGRVFLYLALAVAILLALFPFWWMVDTSLKRPIDIFSGVALWPQQVTFDNYLRLVRDYHFGSFLLNSLIVVTAAVAISLFLGTLAAYALARFRLRFGVRQMALHLVLLVRMVPGIMLCVPLY